jgi:tetratricopeptide (TPR) repeat protein
MPELRLTRSDRKLTLTLGERSASLPWAALTAWAPIPDDQAARALAAEGATYGRRLFDAVFADAALREAVLALPAGTRLQLAADGQSLGAIAWEYLRTPDDRLLAGALDFVRGLSEGEYPAASWPIPLDAPDGLEIVAIPVSPADELRVLNTELEWQRLIGAVRKPGKALALTRVRPPALSQMERTINTRACTIVHFMGHSNSLKGQGVLAFEDECALTRLVSAVELADALAPGVLLAILNSCRSAVGVEWTQFGNVARALVRRGLPYALGMQFVMPDAAAVAVGEALFDHLLGGRSIEAAVRGARRALLDTSLPARDWLAGIPVLYTSRPETASHVTLSPLLREGPARVEPHPAQLEKTCDLSALPTAEHFIGRGREVGQVLEALLDPNGSPFVAIHGMGGIGKTALARAAATHIGWRFSDRVLGVSFETFARLEEGGVRVVDRQFAGRFYVRLARFYGLNPADYTEAVDLQKAILQRRQHLTSLLVLDNVELLVDAQCNRDADAKALAAFVARLREGSGRVLLTTRMAPPADWGACRLVPRDGLGGLDDAAGAALFLAWLRADRRGAAPAPDRSTLSERVKGHPLAIRLLAGLFDATTGELRDFLAAIEGHLREAEQRTPASLEDPVRQATLYACMAYSVDRLTPAQREVLRQISVFRSPFTPEFAALVVDLREAGVEAQPGAAGGSVLDAEKVGDAAALVALRDLVRLGLLAVEPRAFEDGTLSLHELHPMLRWYVGEYLPLPSEAEHLRHGLLYAELARLAYQPEGGYDSSERMRGLVRGSLADFEAALRELPPRERSGLAYYIAGPYLRMGQVRRALELHEEAVESYRTSDDARSLAIAQSSMADVLRQMGRPPSTRPGQRPSPHRSPVGCGRPGRRPGFSACPMNSAACSSTIPSRCSPPCPNGAPSGGRPLQTPWPRRDRPAWRTWPR